MKKELTIDQLGKEAALFAEIETKYDEPTLYGVTDGKAVGTYLEHSPAEYEMFYGLEKKASEIYLVKNQVPIIPCGKPFPERDVLESYQRHQWLSRALEAYGSEHYRAAFDDHVHRESIEEFSYLHSNEYGQAQKWLHEEEERIVVATARREVCQAFQWWHELQRNRDLFIRDGLEKAVLENGYKRVVLFIGAEHRN